MKGLKCCYHVKESRDHASPERIDRTLFLMSLINHLEHIQERMSEHDWQAFSGELYDRILPTTGTQKLHKQDLERTIDGVREQCARWGKNDEQLRRLAEQDERALVLPKKWKEDQELRNQVHRLFRKLGDNEAASAAQLERGQGFMKLGLFFCTDREPSDQSTPTRFFGNRRAHRMYTGLIKVSIPDFDSVASKSEHLPYLWAHSPRRATGDDSKSPELSSCIVMDIGHHIKQAVGYRGAPREATVFIHGFNTDMTWSATHMGTYAYKMRHGMPFFLYEWPSFESYREYGADEGNAMWTVPHFVTFLKDLLTSYNLEKVHLFAHSLGSHVVLYALQRLTAWDPPRRAARLGQLLLVAPDFDTGEFYELQPVIADMVDHITVYCSSNDKPLNLSAHGHGGLPRLGHFKIEAHLSESKHVPLADNIDVIDATGLDKSMAGHTYAFTRADVMEDVCKTLRGERERPALIRKEDRGFKYFRFEGGQGTDSKGENQTVDADSRDTS